MKCWTLLSLPLEQKDLKLSTTVLFQKQFSRNI